MEPGAVPVDADDIIQRYGRRLFVLAYHLIGDGPRAHDLAQECLIRSLLEPAFPEGDRETAVYLIRGLVSLWKERLEPPARAGRSRNKVAAAEAPDPRPGERDVLWRTLSRLDPTSRAALVLRVAGDLEYETIGRILDMAPDVVYARLLQARSRLHPEVTALSNAVFETMNLYLDGRLGGTERGEFERLLASDASLRSRVEFHRGLTLDLQEEAPPLPRDFASRIHDRLDRTRETLALVDQAVDAAGWDPVAALQTPLEPIRPPEPTRPPERPRPPEPQAPAPLQPPAPAPLEPSAAWGKGAGVVALVVAAAGLTLWVARRAPVTAPGVASSAAASPSPGPSATPDEETIEALRSLGYLAPGKKGPKPAATPKPTAKPSANRPSAAPAVTSPGASPAPTPSPTSAQTLSPSPTPEPTPALSATPAAAPSPEPAPAQPGAQAEAAVGWRAVSVRASLDAGRDQRVIRTAAEWSALFAGSGAAAPEVAFDRDMAVLLLPGLEVVSVSRTTEALVVECRRVPSSLESADQAEPAAGQAIILPISDLPVRMVIR